VLPHTPVRKREQNRIRLKIPTNSSTNIRYFKLSTVYNIVLKKVHYSKMFLPGCQWLTPIILTTWEAERRIEV
jgi:hypothetical protein